MMPPAVSGRDVESAARRLLLVGDGVPAAAALESELDGTSVDSEAAGDAALDRLAADDVACAVVGHDPPAFDGVAFCRRAREDHPALPLVLSARSPDAGVVDSALDAGATDVVDADAAAAVLSRRVESALASGVTDDADGTRRRTADGVCTLDDRLRVADANERAATLLARDRDDLLGARAFEQFVTVDGVRLHETCRVARSGGEAATVEAFAPPLARWFDVRVFPDEAGLTVFFTDVTDRARFERTLGVLLAVTGRFAAAASADEVCRDVERAVTSLRSGVRATVYLFDDERAVLRPATVDDRPPVGSDEGSPAWEAFAGATDVVAEGAMDADGEATSVDGGPASSGGGTASVGGEATSDASGAASDASGTSGDPTALFASLGDHGVLAVESTTRALDGRTRPLVRVLANCATGALDRLQCEATLADRTWELEQQTLRLDRLHQATQRLLGVEQAVSHSNTRAELEQAVCDELLADRFGLVWIGSVDDGRVVPRAWAGTPRGYFDDADLSLSADGGEPAVRAVREREVVHVPTVSHGLRGEPWRREMLNRGLQSVLSLPLVHDGTLHGVLTVCATVPDAFDDVSARVFGELADATAHGVAVTGRERALVTDSVVELEVQFPDPTDLLHRLARRAGGTVTFEGVVANAGGESSLYLSVTGGSAGEALAYLEESVPVSRVEHVADGEEADLFVVTVTGGTLVSRVTDAGGAIGELVASPTGTRLAVDLPQSADVRGFVERLQEDHPDAEVLAQRSRERPIESRRTFVARLEERLTDRQFEVLETAYRNGYFEWPRARTGEEVAGLLGITQPTFNNHLRVAERKLFTLLLDGGDERA